MAVGTLRIVCTVPVLRNVDPPEPESWPKLSVVIPACNEADKIEAAVRTVLRQDYPELEIVLIDDRSTDGTGDVVDRLAADDPRVLAVHVTELPDGWLGKVHALDVGVRRATGDWVLFTDADVHYSGDVLGRAVAYCEDRRLDHLAAAPEIWSNRFLSDVAVASFLRSFCVLARCWAIEDPNSGAFVGIGAFNLVRREAFDRTEGFEWLRLEVADDVGLGLMMKRSGARSCMVSAVGLLGLHWYRSIGEMARGVEKGFASVAQCSVVRLLTVCLLTMALELAPLAAFLPVGRVVPGDSSGLWWAGAGMIAAAVFSVVTLARWAPRPRVARALLSARCGAQYGAALAVRVVGRVARRRRLARDAVSQPRASPRIASAIPPGTCLSRQLARNSSRLTKTPRCRQVVLPGFGRLLNANHEVVGSDGHVPELLGAGDYDRDLLARHQVGKRELSGSVGGAYRVRDARVPQDRPNARDRFAFRIHNAAADGSRRVAEHNLRCRPGRTPIRGEPARPFSLKPAGDDANPVTEVRVEAVEREGSVPVGLHLADL